jgi:SAM-dependent methyltransferase
MRSVSILAQTVHRLRLAAQPRRILELGAGDGTLLLRFARAQRPPWRGVELMLLDRVDLLSEDTRMGYREVGWQVSLIRTDVLAWTAAARGPRYDLCCANLFLHHFDAAPLARLLSAVAAASDAFVACEPRRSGVAKWGSLLVGLLGANDVTREDAVKSVAAGFTGRELSAAWGRPDGDWAVEEFPAWPFTHCLAAARSGARLAGAPGA